jgi:hypothetical protein
MPPTGSKREVFVNCPFDPAYTELFNALMFTIYDCGFAPRCAKEIGTGDQRLPKICEMIAECPLGIHDISRTILDPKSKLPRFNMPLELGVFLGHKTFVEKKKALLVLDTSKFRYQKFCSDLAGIDIQAHNERPRDLIRIVRNWLRMNQGVPENIPDGSELFKRYEDFMIERPTICKRLHFRIRGILYIDYLVVVESWVLENPWRPSSSPTLPRPIRRSPST